MFYSIMIVTIHQPDFVPWLGFFDRWQKSDLYIILDDVQFLRRGWHHRDKIKTADGLSKWLTVPILKKGNYQQLIKEVKIDNTSNWRKRHLRTIETNYRKAPNFEHCFEKTQEIYQKNHDFLIDLNMAFLRWLSDELAINTPTVLASDYSVTSKSSQRLAELVESANGDCYLTGAGSKNYLAESQFHSKGIRVIWQEYHHPFYEQLHGKFIPMLSSLDYIMMTPFSEIGSKRGKCSH